MSIHCEYKAQTEENLEQVFALQSLCDSPSCIHTHSVALQAQSSQTLVLLDLTNQLLH